MSSEFEKTGVQMDAHGPFTQLDWSVMDEWELGERLRIVLERIEEYEEEADGIRAEIERRATQQDAVRT